MKRMTLAEFETLVARQDWQREQHIEITECTHRPIEVMEDGDDAPRLRDIPHTYGFAEQCSTLDGITICYSENFSYDDCQPESFSCSTEGMDTAWTIEGVEVVDEDGDPICASDLCAELPGDFEHIDYSTLQIAQHTDIDYDEDSDMETFTIKRDNEPDLRLSGEIIGHAASSANNAAGSRYSGQTGRWTELTLYKTAGGKYVCEQVGRTQWQGERDRFSGAVCETIEEVIEFFGHRWLAKELYAEAGINDVVEID